MVAAKRCLVTVGVPNRATGASLEPSVEPVFHEDSFGYRPGRSAHDALRVCRERCWRNDWVLDIDIKSFFDSVRWDLVLKAAVAHHTDLRWVLLYVERWLKAPLQREDGSLVERHRGTPQGSLCAAAHNDPYEQRWVMRSAGSSFLWRAGLTVERCA